MAEYYTPVIEEFHVGFEYEAFLQQVKVLETPHQEGNDWVYPVENIGYNWVKQEYKQDSFLEYDCIDEEASYRNIYPSEIRVKYLDREDIESLGWEYDNNGEPYPEREPYELPTSFDLDTQLEDGICYILYLYSDKTVWIEWIKDCAGMGYIFKGTIKNKSELKTVLKQLGIWQK
jgi:hypothetical protein